MLGALKNFFVKLKRYIFLGIPAKIKYHQHGRAELKYSRFYATFSTIFGLYASWTLYIFFSMTSPNSSSPYFDFLATRPSKAVTFRYTCTVYKPTFGSFFNAYYYSSIANYLTLSYIVVATGVVALVSCAISLLLYFAFCHFRYKSQKDLNNPSFIDHVWGFVCKKIPSLMYYTIVLQLILTTITSIIIIFFNICDDGVIGVNNPIAQISNCRYWLQTCAGLSSRFGSHYECSLGENYKMFPMQLYEPSIDRSGATIKFPLDYDVLSTNFHLTNDFCGTVNQTIPNCPLCNAVRAQFTNEKNANLPSLENDTLVNSEQNSIESDSEYLDESLWISKLYKTEDKAFASAYMDVLKYFHTGSYVIWVLSLWANISIFILISYITLDDFMLKNVKLEGFFISHRQSYYSSIIKNIKYILNLIGSSILNVYLFVKRQFSKPKKNE